MPEKEVGAPYGKGEWVQVRFRLPPEDWQRVRQTSDPQHIESWLRTAIRRQLDWTDMSASTRPTHSPFDPTLPGRV